MGALEPAFARRGHSVVCASGSEAARVDFSAADLIVAGAEVANRAGLVTKIAAESPGTEIVLVGTTEAAVHPDVIEHLPRPLDVDRLLAVADDVADILDGEHLREPVDLVAYETLFAGDSPQIRDLVRRVRLVARSDAPVWIFGDDGSGRAVAARVIHDRSPRRTGPFVALNSGAHADEHLSRLLFHGDDAAVVRAREGTLFLERVGASGPITQRELVHYLETRSQDERSARLVVGARASGDSLIAPELHYRLKVLEIEIPPLKERARDLEHIVGRMLRRLAPGGNAPEIADEALAMLERYTFPGNLLELAHALTHAYVLARGTSIAPEHLPVGIRQATGEGPATSEEVSNGELESLDVVARRFERDYLLRVLRSVAGNRGRAAEILQLSRKGLWGKLKSHGITDADIDDVA